MHVRFDDLTYEVIPLPNGSAYGFTVDSKGRSWVGGWTGNLQRYDPETQSWTTATMDGYSGLSRGMMEDQNGELWIAGLSTNALLRVDTDTATLIEVIGADKLTGVATPTGASVDFNVVGLWVLGFSVIFSVASAAQYFRGFFRALDARRRQEPAPQ